MIESSEGWRSMSESTMGGRPAGHGGGLHRLRTLARAGGILGCMLGLLSGLTGCSPEPSAPRVSDAQLDRIERDEQDKKRVIVEKDAKWEAADEFDYVRGTVKNNSKRTVKYWKVTAQYIDYNERVFDSDSREDHKTLRPGASRRFEIKHIHTPLAKRARVEVVDVQFTD